MLLFDDLPLLNDCKDVGTLRHWSELISDIEDGRAFSWKEAKSIDGPKTNNCYSIFFRDYGGTEGSRTHPLWARGQLRADEHTLEP